MADPYQDPDRLPEAAIEAMITRLEERGQDRRFVRMIERYASELPVERPIKVLDFGCGTGAVTRVVLQSLHAESEVYGVDVSEFFLREAERRCVDCRVTWQHVRSSQLPYDEAAFDVVIMHTLLSHVADPVEVLVEGRRVLQPGGRLLVFDADHAGTTYSQPSYAMSRRMDYLLSSSIAAHPDICRQMPRLLKQAGFALEKHDAEVISECGKGDYWLSSVQGFARLLANFDEIPLEDGRQWVENMLRAQRDNTFFAAGNFYTFYAKCQH